MAKLFLTDIDLNGNQLLKAILENVATNPASAPLAKGRIAFNTTGNVPIVYDGSVWKNLQYELSGTQTAHNHAVTLSGDVTGSGVTGASIALTLANSGVTAGTYKSVTVDAKGRVTAGTNPTTIAGYGISDAYTKTQIDSSLVLKLDKSIFDELFEKDTTSIPGTTFIKAKFSMYSVGEMSSYGIGTGGSGGGSSYSRLDAWADYDSTKETYVLSALLGNDLNTRLTALEGGSATTFTISGTGNAVTNVTKTGSSFSFVKGLLFAELGADGKVLSSQLPSFVDDVLEFANLAGFPATGETGKIYVAIDTSKTYRWSGTSYVEISASLALGTTSSTAFRGDYGNIAYNHAVAKGSAYASGLYKITTNAEGHVTGAVAVVKADITALGVPAQDTTYSVVTTSVNGLMSAADKAKLDGIAAGANNYTHPTGDGNLHVPATGTTNNGKVLKAGATAGSISWGTLSVSDITGAVKKVTGTLSTSSTSYTIAHGLGNKYCVVQVKQVSDGAVVECDIKVDATNVTLLFNVAPTANTYEYTILG